MTRIPIIIAGLILFFVGLPLANRKIAMNKMYGYRVPQAYKSERHWYEINAYAGKQLCFWSVVIVLAGVAGFFVPREHLLKYDKVSVLLLVLPVFIALIRTGIWVRKNMP